MREMPLALSDTRHTRGSLDPLGTASCRVGLGLLCTATLFACSHAPELASRWASVSHHVDGDDTEWGDARYYLEDTPISIALANDAEYLYLCVTSSDMSLQIQVATRGVELWLDPRGGRDTYFGLRLPGADIEDVRTSFRSRPDASILRGQRPSGSPQNARSVAPPMDPERLAGLFAAMEARSEIFVLDAPEDEGWQTTLTDEALLQACLRYDRGRMVYEARVPLVYRGYPPYETGLGRRALGLALRVPKPQQPTGSVRGGMSGGRGGGKGGGMGRRGGMGDMRPVMAEAAQQWVKVRLAEVR